MTLDIPYRDMNQKAAPKHTAVDTNHKSAPILSLSDTYKANCHSSTLQPLEII